MIFRSTRSSPRNTAEHLALQAYHEVWGPCRAVRLILLPFNEDRIAHIFGRELLTPHDKNLVTRYGVHQSDFVGLLASARIEVAVGACLLLHRIGDGSVLPQLAEAAKRHDKPLVISAYCAMSAIDKLVCHATALGDVHLIEYLPRFRKELLDWCHSSGIDGIGGMEAGGQHRN